MQPSEFNLLFFWFVTAVDKHNARRENEMLAKAEMFALRNRNKPRFERPANHIQVSIREMDQRREQI